MQHSWKPDWNTRHRHFSPDHSKNSNLKKKKQISKNGLLGGCVSEWLSQNDCSLSASCVMALNKGGKNPAFLIIVCLLHEFNSATHYAERWAYAFINVFKWNACNLYLESLLLRGAGTPGYSTLEETELLEDEETSRSADGWSLFPQHSEQMVQQHRLKDFNFSSGVN